MARKIEVQIVGDSRSLERAFSRATKSGEGFGSRFSRGLRNAGQGIGVLSAAVVGLGAVSVKSFGSFQESMERIVGLAGGSQRNIEKFTDQVLELSTVTGKGPQELADALYFVASSGIAANKQMGVLTVSAKAAAAGLGETQVVADAVSSVMNAYGGNVVTAAHATDVLVATVREGKGEASDFSSVIGTVAAIASQLGVSIDEVGAALAAQTRLGISAETASTNLQAVFSSLLKVTPKTAKAMKAVGLTHAGLRKELKEKGLLAVLQTLKERFGDNTAAMAEAFPNIRALRGLLTLVGKNADQVSGVFNRMKNSTGALDLAFKTVSKGTAFQFKTAMSNLAVAGIRLGALFAPVASKLAQGAGAALKVVSGFLKELGKAKTVKQKLNVVWQGVKDAGKGAQNLLNRAIKAVDWDEVWKGARGMADGLQKQIEKVDWSGVGKSIGDGIKAGAGALFPAAQDIADRLSKAIRSIQWEKMGKAMGPGLAAAVATAFATLLDPGFWIRNWDLALSVAIAVMPGGVGKIGKFLLKPFAKLGADAILAMGVAFEKFAPRVAGFLLRVLEKLPGLAARALAPLAGVVGKLFGRLGRLSRFVIKVLGIDAAINAVVGFAKDVGHWFKNIAGTIKRWWNEAMDWLEKKALVVALKIIEPFTHIPKRLGGGTFQKLKKEWNTALDAMETKSATTASTVNKNLGGIKNKKVTLTIETKTKGAIAPDDRPGPHGPGGIEAAQEAQTRKLQNTVKKGKEEDDKRDKIAAAAAKAKAAAAAKAKQAAEAAKKAAEKQRAGYDKLIDSLSLKLEMAGATKGFKDDIRAQNAIIAAIQKQIKVEGKTTELLRALFEARQNRRELVKSQREAAQAQRQKKQFAELGLDETGQAKTPGLGALRRRLGQIQDLVKGTFMDTPKTRSELKRIAKFLATHFKGVGKDVRAAIMQMFDDIKSAFDSGDQKGPLTKFSVMSTAGVTKGLGLTREQALAVQQRVAGRGRGGTVARRGAGVGGAFGLEAPVAVAGGGRIVNFHGPVTVVANNPEEFLRALDRRKRRGAVSRSGPRAGQRGD